MDFLTNPFIVALLFLYNLLGQNIILAIIIFTVLTRVITYPLTAQQMKSTAKMQGLQPRLKELQAKHKGDREKMSQAQMELYKTYGVNPLGGCLPLVVQMPILFGLYGAITHALAANPLQMLDLAGRIQGFGFLASTLPVQNQFLWLNLGLPDPTPILPILVIASTYFQSKVMTPPPSGDPNDPSAAISRNMTIMMPLMIGLLSVQFASGLSIYWVISNFVGMGQYALVKRFQKTQPLVPVISSAAGTVSAVSAGDTKRKAIPATASATRHLSNGSSNGKLSSKANGKPSTMSKATVSKAAGKPKTSK